MGLRRSDYEKLVALLISLAIVGALVVFYLTCLVATQLSVTALAALSGGGRRESQSPQSEGLVAGLVVAGIWTGACALVIGAFSGTQAGWIAGLCIGAPVGAVVGWQSMAWQEADAWSRTRNALLLGVWRSGRFFVERPYTVTAGERAKHLVCAGATGTGKSTLVRNLILQDLKAGAGLCVIDPKDDLIDGILGHIPSDRLDDVILFDAADTERPLGINPLANVPASQRSIAASELIAVFRRYFADAWGARLEHVLRNVTLALLEVPGATLADVPRLLLDRAYAQWVAARVTNPAVREFLTVEYEEVLKRRSDAIEPILNKVGPWLSYPELRNIIGQRESAFDLRQVMDEGKVLLVRIPQGVLGEDVSNLLGALIVARVQLAAQSRVNVPADKRRPFFLYVDEFQNFATSSFAKILTEARAFNVGLVCVNQYPEQLGRDLQLALLHNAATFVTSVYQRGRYLLEVIRQEDVREKKPPVYVVTPRPPLGAGDPERARTLRESSRQRYGRRPYSGETAIADFPAASGSGTAIASNGWGRDLDEE